MNKLLLKGTDPWCTERLELSDAPIKRDGIRGRGGEGKVHDSISHRGCVAKIYDRADDARRRKKVEAMLSSKPKNAEALQNGVAIPLLAWPTHIVLEEDSRFAGFAMPKVPSDFVSLASWQWRRQKPPKENPGAPLDPNDESLPSRISGCRNLARLVQSVNEQGYWVIDLGAENIFVQRKHMRVCLIDCDSFSIAVDGKVAHAALVAREEVRAPEFQAGSPDRPAFTSDSQDRFALAVVIFRWLNRNLHPYQGRPQVDTESNTLAAHIAARRYAYGLEPHPEMLPSMGSEHESFPLDLRRLFDRAFLPAGDPLARPSAKEWVEILQRFKTEGRLSKCARFPSDVSHYHFTGMACPRCQRAEQRESQGNLGPNSGLQDLSLSIPKSMPSTSVAQTSGTMPLDSKVPETVSAPSTPPATMTPKRTKWPSRKVVLVVVVLVALVLIGYVHHATGLWPWQGGVQVLLETLSS